MVEYDIGTIIAASALAISAYVVFARAIDKGLSLREHQEFKSGVEHRLKELMDGQEKRLIIREFADWRTQINDDIDRVEKDIREIDRTKPTTGELQMAVRAVEARLVVMEENLKVIRNNHV